MSKIGRSRVEPSWDGPIYSLPASAVPAARTGASPHYLVRADGTVESLLPATAAASAAADHIAAAAKAFSGMGVTATWAAESMGNLMRVMWGDDFEVHDDYILQPDPPPAYLYR